MKRKLGIFVCLLSMLLPGGCQLKKEIEVDIGDTKNEEAEEGHTETEGEEEEVLTGSVLLLEYVGAETYNYMEITPRLILGISPEEAEQYRVQEGIDTFETDGKYYSAMEDYARFGDNTYGLANCYAILTKNDYYNSGQGMRQIWPLEDLDTCSGEEAIAFCAPYAKALGWEGEDVTVSACAWTLDYLQTRSVINSSRFYSAPDESYEFASVKKIHEAKAAGREEEAERWISERYTILDRNVPWEKKHEAIALLYQRSIDGIPVDSRTQVLFMIYVPYYNEIVYAEADAPYVKKEVLREEKLISRKEAAQTAVVSLGGGNTSIQVDGVSMVYILKYIDDDDMNMDNWQKREAVPAWRVDYTKNGIKDSVWVNAVDGYIWEY